MLYRLGLYLDKAVGFSIMTHGSGFWINAMTNRWDTLTEIVVMMLFFFRELKDYLIALLKTSVWASSHIRCVALLSIYSFLADVQWLWLDCHILLGVFLSYFFSGEDRQPRIPVSIWQWNEVKYVRGEASTASKRSGNHLILLLRAPCQIYFGREQFVRIFSMLYVQKADYRYQIC